jgi:hypothetical protein
VRQWWVPAEFRLPEPEFTKEQLDLLEELIQMITPNLSRAESATIDGRMQMANFLVDLGTGIWRIRRKIEGLSRMPKEIRDALYSLESMWMSMSEGGVEIVDHIGTMPSVREAKIVDTREMPGLVREQVIDAVKPTILLRGEVVQLGEVILGKPASSVNAAKYQELEAEETEPAEAAPVEPDETEYISEDGGEETPPPVHEAETFTMTPPLKAWEPEAPTEPKEPEPAAGPETAIEENVAEISEMAAVPADEPRLDSEAAIVLEEIESPKAATETEASETQGGPDAKISPDKDQEETEGENAAIEIPLPRKAPRRGRTVREAVKQAILEEPEAAAFDDTGRAKRRKARAAAVKNGDAKKPPRKKVTPKQQGEEE